MFEDQECSQKSSNSGVAVAAAIGAATVGGYVLKKFGGLETPGVTICSFNLWNLQSHVSGNDSDPTFRAQRIQKVADLIARNHFGVVVLQEVKTPETVNDICKRINESAGFGRYNGVHCSDAYEQIFAENGYSGKTATTLKRAELAFIWDSMMFEPACDDYAKVVYKGIDNSINHVYDVFFASLAALVVGGMRCLNRNEDEEKRVKHEAALDGSAVAAAAVAVNSNNHAASKIVEWTKDETEEWLRQNLRPPFVLLLNFRNNRKKQLRLINVHLQFGLTSADEEYRQENETRASQKLRIRQEEVKLLAKNDENIFDIVNSQRSGGNETAITIVAGDFNLNVDQIKSDSTGGMNVSEDMIVAQTKKSSLSLKAAPDTEDHNKVICPTVHSYDHFMFKSDVWCEDDAKVLDSPDPLNDDGFYAEKIVNDKTVLHPISDHLPIVIKSTKI